MTAARKGISKTGNKNKNGRSGRNASQREPALATLAAVRKEIKALADPERAVGVARFFKTGKGEYGEGDKFLGLYVPQLHALEKKSRGLPRTDVVRLLHSPWHEERALALMLLVEEHERSADAERREIRKLYLANTKYINNWDLVDLSAGQIVGAHVASDGTKLLEKLAKSTSLWERRIAMLGTFYSIKQKDFEPALLIAERLLGDTHDLMHKAVGWMLREVGKRSPETLRGFLETHAGTMPRTALRYAIERFTPEERSRWMKKRVNGLTG